LSLAMDEETRTELLNRYYKEVHATILTYQSPTLGLFPWGEDQHARVRDNVMCATGLWHLSLAYRQMGADKGRTYELEQCTVKCMRGILFCYMRQSDKVERFKHRQSGDDSLHARFDCHTGDEVMDHNWGRHLQIDASALFLLTIAQMTASGVQIIFTMDEVNFIQNLVFYVERAYRIPDFGIWERGSRENVGKRELHASSIGMAKAALEALNGLNLFGEKGCPQSTIHVDPDAQYRNCLILNTLLPRESTSKETDASLLTVTGYPAFAIDDPDLQQATEVKVKETLAGEKGYKRFLRDSYLTVREGSRDSTGDTSVYDRLECEYPLFFLYEYISEMCRGNTSKAEKVWKKVVDTLTEFEDHMIVPQLYYVPESELSNEAGTSAGSIATARDVTYRMEVRRDPIPFLWAQSLFYTAKLLRDGLISVPDLDPLGLRLQPHTRRIGVARHLGFKAPGHDTVIQVALISETTRLQTLLATHGVPTQTQKQVEPIKIRPPGDILMRVYARLGENGKLGLTGRPKRPLGALATSRVYRIYGMTFVFYPTDSMADFYTSFDVMTLIDVLKTTLQFLNLNWNMAGRPTLCLYLTESRLKGNNFRKFVNFLAQLKQGEVEGLKVRVDRLQSLIRTSCIERLECGHWDQLDRHLQQSLMSRSVLRSRGSAARLSSCASSASETSIGSVFEVGGAVGGAEERDPDDPDFSDGEEEEPSYLPAEIRDKKQSNLRNLLLLERNSLGQLYLLNEMVRTRGSIDLNSGETAEERIEAIYLESGVRKRWMSVRYAAALLRKVVDCLAPSLTAMLVRGKEVTIGVFGYAEHVVTEPMSPKDLVKIIYDMCMPADPIEAVLQQEIIIYLADVFTSRATVFQGMLRLRIGWIIQAMKNELKDPATVEKLNLVTAERRVEQLSPHQVKQLLIYVLQDIDSRSVCRLIDTNPTSPSPPSLCIVCM
jgi:phosphorylase kinase alpha/beta subunit